jgi:hypothetical protein
MVSIEPLCIYRETISMIVDTFTISRKQYTVFGPVHTYVNISWEHDKYIGISPPCLNWNFSTF